MRPDQALAEGNRPRGALVITGRGRHVRDRGQRPGLQVLVVLVQADDVAGERRVVGEPVEVDQGHPGGLGLRVGRRRGLIRLRAVVALDVELPAHAGRLEPVEDRQLVPVAARRDPAGAAGRGDGRHPVGPVVTDAVLVRREEMIEEHVIAGDLPVEGQRPAVVVAHRGGSVAPLPLVGGDEAVHLPAVVLVGDDRVVRAERRQVAAAQQERLDAAVGRLAGDPGLAGAGRQAVRTGIGAEVVVEGPAALHEEDEVLDRRDRLVPCRRGAGPRTVTRPPAPPPAPGQQRGRDGRGRLDQGGEPGPHGCTS